MEISHAEDVFVSDVTYINTEEGYCYLSIVGNAYTKKIMGYHLSQDMYAHSILIGLIKALKNRQYNRNTTHHSDQASPRLDRGSKTYTDACKLSNILISMAEKGKTYENTVAERMIGILKGEFEHDQKFKNYHHASKIIPQVIHSYNTKRPHLSCGYLIPEEVHYRAKGLEKKWRPKSYQHINKKKKSSKKGKNTTTTNVKLI